MAMVVVTVIFINSERRRYRYVFLVVSISLNYYTLDNIIISMKYNCRRIDPKFQRGQPLRLGYSRANSGSTRLLNKAIVNTNPNSNIKRSKLDLTRLGS